ncbi:MAG TPA: hypothetical protein VNT30_25740 [Stellaceae bacterium]|nr:hypothetical protein [Stellaceae bacterium]
MTDNRTIWHSSTPLDPAALDPAGLNPPSAQREPSPPEIIASWREVGVAEPAEAVMSTVGQRGVAAQVVLCVAATTELAASDAVRDIALSAAATAGRPTLLLDLGGEANRHHRDFAAEGRLEPRRGGAPSPLPEHAVLHFHQVRGSWLHVSRIEPAAAVVGDVAWQLAAMTGIRRLRPLFGAIVIEVPPLDASLAGLRLASVADGVVLLIRAGRTPVGEAMALRDRISYAGGHPLGVAFAHTGSPSPAFFHRFL